MDIWILVIVLLVIAIILFVLSMYAEDDALEEQLQDTHTEQAEELYRLESRLAELERLEREREEVDALEVFDQADDPVFNEEPVMEDLVITDETQDEIIRLYSHGYTMNEIADQIHLEPGMVRQIVDDYIENR